MDDAPSEERAHERAPHDAEGPSVMALVGLGVLVLLAFVSFLDRHVVTLMVAPIEADLHISDGQIGMLQGPAFTLLYPLFAIPIGYAADRYSRRWVIFWSVTLWALCAMGSGLAGSPAGCNGNANKTRLLTSVSGSRA